jgi:hypothetical protein
VKTYTNPRFPGKTFRRLKVGEKLQPGDAQDYWGGGDWEPVQPPYIPIPLTEDDKGDYYREISPEDRADLLLARINEVIQKLDAVLAKLND